MEPFIPSGIPWLSEDEKFLNGIELGALIAFCQIRGLAMVQAKIRWGNEDQLRVIAPVLGYDFAVDKRDEAFCYVTLTTN